MEKWQRFSEEEIKDIILNSNSFKEVAEKFGYSGCNGQMSKKIRQIATDRNLDAPYLNKKVLKKEDYIGKMCGELEVIKIDEERTKVTGITHFACKCHHCNKEELHIVSITGINKTKTCGCIKNERFVKGRYEDLTGQVFQHFKVLELNKEETIKHDKTYWNCLCLRCNKNIVPVWAWVLKDNKRDNCGCYNRKSKGEEKVNQILTELGISFRQEYSFKDFYTTKGHPYRFDFAIFEDNQLKYLIEYHGKQHYKDGWKDKESLEEIQKRDNIKEQYCKEHNIPLIIIPYTDLSQIDTQYLLNKINEVSM